MEFIDRIIHALTVTHPIHPMIVHFPIALSGTAALFILLSAWKKSKPLEQAAFANIVLASVGTLAAGLTGMMDNLENYDGVAPNSSTKMVLATILLIITASISFFRWRNPALMESRAKLFYVLGYLVSFALALVLAFLGGVILYGY